MLKILPKFTQGDHDEFQAAYAKTSSWAARHDNAPEENYIAPTVEDLCDEVRWLKGWHARIGAVHEMMLTRSAQAFMTSAPQGGMSLMLAPTDHLTHNQAQRWGIFNEIS